MLRAIRSRAARGSASSPRLPMTSPARNPRARPRARPIRRSVSRIDFISAGTDAARARGERAERRTLMAKARPAAATGSPHLLSECSMVNYSDRESTVLFVGGANQARGLLQSLDGLHRYRRSTEVSA